MKNTSSRSRRFFDDKGRMFYLLRDTLIFTSVCDIIKWSTHICDLKNQIKRSQLLYIHYIDSIFAYIHSLFYIYSPQECGCSLVGEAARECELVQEATKRCWGLSDLKIGWTHLWKLCHMKPYLLFFRLKASKFYERVNCRILILKAIETIVAKGVKISTDQFPPQKN